MKWILLYAIVHFTLLLWTQVEAVVPLNKSDEQRLIEDLFAGYNAAVRPITDPLDSVLISISVCFMQLMGVDEQLQTMSTHGWIEATWDDPRLTWTPADYGNVTMVTVPPTYQPWLPRFTILNTAAEDIYNGEYYKWFGVQIYDTGQVVWMPGGYFNTQCHLDITYYPFDTQRCEIIFSNWIYTGNQVNLTHHEDAESLLLSSYVESGEWDVIGSTISRKDEVYEYGIPYPRVTVELVLRRKYLFYITSLLIPCVILSLLAMFVFRLPPESGEKVSLCTSLLLSFVVYIMVLSENLPTTSITVPLIEIYLLMALSSTAVTVVMSISVIRAFHKSDMAPPPGFLLKMCCIRPESRANDVEAEKKTAAVFENNMFVDIGKMTESTDNTDQQSRVVATGTKEFRDVMSSLHRITDMMESYREEKTSGHASERNRLLWKQVAVTIDRYCFFFLGALLTTMTLAILAIIPIMHY